MSFERRFISPTLRFQDAKQMQRIGLPRCLREHVAIETLGIWELALLVQSGGLLQLEQEFGAGGLHGCAHGWAFWL
jgi:hypothetical protein